MKKILLILPLLLGGCVSNITPNTHTMLGGASNSQHNPTNISSHNSGMSEDFVKGLIAPMQSQIKELQIKNTNNMLAIEKIKVDTQENTQELLKLEYNERIAIRKVMGINTAVIQYLTLKK